MSKATRIPETNRPANELAGEADIELPIERELNPSLQGEGSIVVRVRFNQSAYRALDKISGVNHYARFQAGAANFTGADVVPHMLFAGTRYLGGGAPTLDNFNEWLDAVPSYKLAGIYGAVIEAFTTSIRGPKSGEAPLEQASIPSTTP